MELINKNKSYLSNLQDKILYYTNKHDINDVPVSNTNSSQEHIYKLSRDVNTYNRRLYQCQYKDFRNKTTTNKNTSNDKLSNQLSKNFKEYDDKNIFLTDKTIVYTKWRKLDKDIQIEKIKEYCIKNNISEDKITEIIKSFEKNILKNGDIMYNEIQERIVKIVNIDMFMEDNSIQNIMNRHLISCASKKRKSKLKNTKLNLFFK